jgi:hypothetical protein
MLAIAVVAVAALLVISVRAAWQWLSPPGYELVVTRPEHGTILGEGIECGSRGGECSVSAAKGRRVDLAFEADSGYVFEGFTGACAQGWVVMSEPRTCGATFQAMGQAARPVLTYPLTIEKPANGTIQAVGDIECGLMGSKCVAQLDNGSTVEIYAKPDNGYMLQNFTGDCSADGRTRMTAPRQCGAVFAPKGTKTPAPVTGLVGEPKRTTARSTDIAKKADPITTTAPAGEKSPLAPGGEKSSLPAGNSNGTPAGTATATPAGSSNGTIVVKDAPPVVTAEEHAKAEIQQLVKDYCSALESRDPRKVRNLFPNVNMKGLEYNFKETISLKCTVTPPVEYIALHAESVGSATIKFAIKQVQVMKTSGAKETREGFMTMRLARADFTKPWRIDHIDYEKKE